MKQNKLWMIAAILICGTMTVLTACNDSKTTESDTSNTPDVEKMKEEIRAQYGENKNTWAMLQLYRRLNPRGRSVTLRFEGSMGDSENRNASNNEVAPNDSVYEAYYNAKSPCQNESFSEGASLYYQGEDCLYLNVWKSAETTATEKKPVMVWIHGGAFEFGGTADPLYECRNFVEENPDIIHNLEVLYQGLLNTKMGHEKRTYTPKEKPDLRILQLSVAIQTT